jgi:galactose mutarotase-like enzyme
MVDDMKVAVSYQYKKEYDYYPFPFELDVTYQLDAPDQLSVLVEIKNTGTGNMPFGFGWHPYFCLGEPVKDMDYLAIKPMTCSINAFNNGDGLQVLEAGESVSGKFGASLI